MAKKKAAKKRGKRAAQPEVPGPPREHRMVDAERMRHDIERRKKTNGVPES